MRTTFKRNTDIHGTCTQCIAYFFGTWRRLEYKGTTQNGIPVYDDYAHHPTEVHASISALKERYPQKKIIAILCAGGGGVISKERKRN